MYPSSTCIHLSINQSIDRSIDPSTYRSIYPSIFYTRPQIIDVVNRVVAEVSSFFSLLPEDGPLTFERSEV